jgi:hypothetical protein
MTALFNILSNRVGAEVAQALLCLTTQWMIGRSGFDPRQGQGIFPLSSVSRSVLGPTQPPVQWVPGVLSPRVKRGLGVTLTTHRHLVLKSWMSRSYTSSPPSASMACSRTARIVLSLENMFTQFWSTFCDVFWVPPQNFLVSTKVKNVTLIKLNPELSSNNVCDGL